MKIGPVLWKSNTFWVEKLPENKVFLPILSSILEKEDERETETVFGIL